MLSSVFSSKISSVCGLADSSIVKIIGADKDGTKPLGNYNKIERHPSGRLAAIYETNSRMLLERC